MRFRRRFAKSMTDIPCSQRRSYAAPNMYAMSRM